LPKDIEQEVREWVESYRTVRELLEKLSEVSWERLQAHKARKKK